NRSCCIQLAPNTLNFPLWKARKNLQPSGCYRLLTLFENIDGGRNVRAPHDLYCGIPTYSLSHQHSSDGLKQNLHRLGQRRLVEVDVRGYVLIIETHVTESWPS